MDWKKGIAEALHKDFLHRPLADTACVVCGATGKTYAMHVIQYYHDEKLSAPKYLIPTSNSLETTRGSVPLCHDCCPPCTRCQLPIATSRVKQLIVLLSGRTSGIEYRVGNGHCTEHFHVWHGIKARIQRARLADLTLPETPQMRAAALREAWESSFDPATRHPVWGFLVEDNLEVIQDWLENTRRDSDCDIDSHASTDSVPSSALESIYMWASWLSHEEHCDIRILLIMIHQFIDTEKAVRERHWENWAYLMHTRSKIAPPAESYVDFIQESYLNAFGKWTLTRQVDGTMTVIPTTDGTWDKNS